MYHQVTFLQKVMTYQEILGELDIFIYVLTFAKKEGTDSPNQ